MNYRQEFERFLMAEYPSIIGKSVLAERTVEPGIAEAAAYIQGMYFTDPQGCVNEAYLGGDVATAIHDKYFYCIAFLRYLFDRMHLGVGEMYITIDPSFEDETICILHLCCKNGQRVILLEEASKAWNFWFEEEDDSFDWWVENALEEMEHALFLAQQVAHVVVAEYAGLVTTVLAFHNEGDAKRKEEELENDPCFNEQDDTVSTWTTPIT